MNKKALIFGGGAIAVVAIVVALIFIFTGGEDAYRSIKVFEIDGTCTVERDGDTLDAFKNMSLSSGDSFTVGEGSFARLKLDDDKYVYLEANTKINLTATGTANDSKTMVYIERGSMLTEVKKKLSATSSYDIVTPNTTMSIRGTKTLTEVIEDVVTGHVQTSNAVLEGQVKIKAVKVKADGTVVSVERDLGAGEGNAFKSSKEELVSQEEMQAIAETGASVSGIKVEIVSEEDADVVFDVATFDATFLESVKSILIADAEAAAGEGLSDEELDAINAQIDEAIKSLDVIREESQNAINAATETDNPEPEPTPELTPEPTPEVIIEPDWNYTPVTETSDDQDEGTTLVDGDTSLVVIGDDVDDADDDVDTGNEIDDTDDADTDDNVDEDGDEEGADEEGNDNNDADEEDNDGEDEEDGADDEGDEEDADKEGEEKEDTNEEEKEKEESDVADEEESGQNSDESSDNTGSGNESSSDSGSSPSSGTSTGSVVDKDSEGTIVTIASSSRNYSMEYEENGTMHTSTWSVDLSYIKTSDGSKPSSADVSRVLSAGDPLPGCEGSPYEIKLMLGSEITHEYEFVGWYTVDPLSNSFDESYRITSVPSSPLSIYAGIREVQPVTRTYSVTLVNLFQEAGTLVVPSSGKIASLDGTHELTITQNQNRVTIDGFLEGESFVLPEVQRLSESRNGDDYRNKLYIQKTNATNLITYVDFYCYTTNMDLNAGKYCIEGKNYDSDTTSGNIYNPVLFQNIATGSTLPNEQAVSVNDDITLYMNFLSKAVIKINAFYVDGLGLTTYVGLNVPGSNNGVQPVSTIYTGINTDDNPYRLIELNGTTAEKDQQWWALSKSQYGQTERESVYELSAYYYGKRLNIPTFNYTRWSEDSSYNRAILTNYRSKRGGNVVPFINGQFSFAGSGAEGFPFTGGAFCESEGVITITAQDVDYVVVDLSDLGLDIANIGDNNPYLIKETRTDRKYKMAIMTPGMNSQKTEFTGDGNLNLFDAYTDNKKVFPYNVSATIAADRTGVDNTVYDWSVYLPDDLIYPWCNIGGVRTGYTVENTPSDIYSGISGGISSSFAYVAKTGNRLIGYNIQGQSKRNGEENPNTFNVNWIFHQGDSHFLPCSSGDESIGCLMSMETFLRNSQIINEFTIKPLFASIKPFEVSLEYTQTGTGRQISVIGDYNLVFTGFDTYFIQDVFTGDLRVRAYDIDDSDGHTRITDTDIALNTKLRYLPDANKYQVWTNGGSQSTALPTGSPKSYTPGSDGKVRIPLTDMLSVPSIIPSLDKVVLYGLYLDTGVNHIAYRSIYDDVEIRDHGSVGETVTIEDYKPDTFMIKPAQIESYKYTVIFSKATDSNMKETDFIKVIDEETFAFTSGPGGYRADLTGSGPKGYWGGYLSSYLDTNDLKCYYYDYDGGECNFGYYVLFPNESCGAFKSLIHDTNPQHSYSNNYIDHHFAGVLRYWPFTYLKIINGYNGETVVDWQNGNNPKNYIGAFTTTEEMSSYSAAQTLRDRGMGGGQDTMYSLYYSGVTGESQYANGFMSIYYDNVSTYIYVGNNSSVTQRAKVSIFTEYSDTVWKSDFP
ncbi:MAG: FecR domain-containing protein [Lachnospiraceae bacterium]|nr:FecR domain-containing protein [Lachnospiraceae bacterium]MBR5369373.1 FecR domain-containing protein [Lachnospiraceae bacterium]